MCMLSFYPESVMPVREHLLNGLRANPDGSGYAILADGELLTGKSMSQEKILDEFLLMRELWPSGPAMFHSRIATGGTVTADNCHPYTAGRDDRTAIGHNGIMFYPAKGEKRSDTRIFAEDIFPQYFRRLNRPTVLRAMEQFINPKGKAWNKVAIITANPRYDRSWWLVGEDLGWWVDGEGDTQDIYIPGVTAWHSNSDYRGWKSFRTGWDEQWYGGKTTRGPVEWEKTGDNAWRALYPGDPGHSLTLRAPEGREQWKNCPYCFVEFSVDPLIRYCENCDGCYDCAEHKYVCECWDAITLGYDKKESAVDEKQSQTPMEPKKAPLMITAGS